MGWSGYQKKEFYSIFRPIYKDKYVFQCELYPGMMQLLNELNEKGMLVGIATNKRKDSTEPLLQYLKIDRLFDTVIAQDQNEIRNKTDMILDALKELRTDKEEAVMIGDTIGDLDAARDAGVDFIGVRYGFGFKERIEDDREFADSVDELKSLLCSKI
jgi:phosphoglycolate phosphatase